MAQSAPATDVSEPPQSPEARQLRLVEAREAMDRCRRMLAQPAIVARLPDKGAALQRKLASHVATIASLSAPPTVEVVPQQTEEETAKKNIEAAKLLKEQRESDMLYQMQLSEKYRHHRVDAAVELKESLKHLLCDAELELRTKELSKTYFLTFDETIAVERELAEVQRRHELDAIKRKNSKQQ